jgi:hypothetical protein
MTKTDKPEMARNVKKTARMPAMKFPKLQKRLRAAKIPISKGPLRNRKRFQKGIQ